MNKILLTEVDLAARLFQFGILRHIESSEFGLYMTDLCYYAKNFDNSKNFDCLKEMVNNGVIKIIELNEPQMERSGKLYRRFYPKFLLKTVSAFVIATEGNFSLISEDELVRSVAIKDLGIPSYGKQWLVDLIINNIKDETIVANAGLLRLVI